MSGWAADYIGLPYLEDGRTRAGLNCWELCRLVYRERLGIELPEFGFAYGLASDTEATGAVLAAHRYELAPAAEPRDFDFIFMMRLRRLAPHHIGLYVAPARVLHVAEGIDSQCPRFDRPTFGYHVEGVYRLPALAEIAA